MSRCITPWCLALLCAVGAASVAAAPAASRQPHRAPPAKPTNFLHTVVDEARIVEIFGLVPGGLVNKARVVDFLLSAGVQSRDANKTGTPQKVQDEHSQSELDAEFTTYSQAYFGTAGLTVDQVHQIITDQDGYTPSQFLAYLRVAYGPGRCASRVGTKKCFPIAGDFQMAIVKGTDSIVNLRYPSLPDDTWKNVFAIHREDIAYRLIFDEVARRFGAGDHNPMRDVVLDPADPQTCRRLTSLLANGATFTNSLLRIPNMPPVLAAVSAHLLDGVTEASPNLVTGVMTTYHYGMFTFMQGRNCSRYDANNQCYVGEPLLPIYLQVEKGVPLPREDGQYSWTCAQIAALVDTVVSNPYAAPYDVLSTEETYAFDPATYPLRGQPVQLTAEDLLMFYVAAGNAQINVIGNKFADNLPVADVEALGAAGIENPEYAFQFATIPVLYDMFLH